MRCKGNSKLKPCGAATKEQVVVDTGAVDVMRMEMRRVTREKTEVN